MSKQLQTTEQAIQTVQDNNQEYYELGCNYAEKWMETRFKPFTSEDLSADMYSILGVPREPRVLGAIIRTLRVKNLIKSNGYKPYSAKQGHGRPSTIWISLKYSEIQAENRRIKNLKLEL